MSLVAGRNSPRTDGYGWTTVDTTTTETINTHSEQHMDDTYGDGLRRFELGGGGADSSTGHAAFDTQDDNGGTTNENAIGNDSARKRRKKMSKTRAHIKVATLNMRGFGGPRAMQTSEKWWSLNQVVRDERIAILAVQETHLTEERVDALNTLFKATMKVIACLEEDNPTGARGVAFVLNRRLVNAEDAMLIPVRAGRAAILKVPWTRGKVLQILNVYAPNDMQENAAFWMGLREAVTNRRTGRIDIMLGDFNVVEDAVDRIPPRRDLAEAAEQLAELRVKLDLVDGWRERAPREKGFSYLQRATGSQSRIDRIYLKRDMMIQANDWDIRGPGIQTDHRLVVVSLANTEAPYVGKGRWAIPQPLLSDKRFLDELHGLGMMLQSQLERMRDARTPMTNPQTVYAQFKRAVVSMAKARAKQSVPKLDRTISALKRDIAEKLNGGDATSDDLKNDVAIMQERLIELELRRFGKKRLVVAVNDWAQGETICRYWTKLNAIPLPSTVIHELLETQPDGSKTVITRSDVMARVAKLHYDGLQADPGVCRARQETDTARVLSSVTVKLTTIEKGEMAEKIKRTEMDQAIRDSANGKAPGVDGIPTEIWKGLALRCRADAAKKRPAFDVVKALQCVFNDIEEYGVADDTGFADGWICPIYKLKKDTRDIVNYRPITLLNSDYKVMTRVLAMRVAAVAAELIHPDQAGFLPGRQIFDHIKLNKLIIDYAEAEESNGMIVALDQEKAYDKIDHTYLWSVLKRFNFPENLIRTIRNLYAAANSTVVVNGVLSEWFRIVRGVRQGDPMSCLLFDLAIEPLAAMLRASSLRGLTIPGTAERLIAKLFADDTTTYLNEEDNCAVLFEILREWCAAARAKFNDDKTEYIPIGSKAYRTGVVARTSRARVSATLPAGARIVADGTGVRSLGAWIGNNTDETAPWTTVVEAIKSRLAKWGQRRPTMYGRKLAVGMELGGRTQFLTRAQTMPAAVEKKLHDMAVAFVWDGDAHPRISQNTLHRPLNQGGLNLIDVQARNEAVDLVWLREYLNLTPTRPTWAYVADALFGRAVAASARSVEDDAKENTFLQSWKVSLRSTGLPEDLKRMIRAATKYGVRVDSPNPAAKLKRAMPVWYHLGKAGGRSTANCKAARCLRANHGVSTVLDASRVAGRLPRTGGQAGQHRTTQKCGCVPCDEDRRLRGCDNPHRCAVAAAKLLENLMPVWKDEDAQVSDGLTLTARRVQLNADARAENGRMVFDPTITDTGELTDVFRVFVDTELDPRRVATRRPPRPYMVREEAVEVHTDGSCNANGGGNAAAGSGVWFGNADGRNLALRVPARLNQSNQVAEIYAVTAAAAVTPPFAPLHIVSDSKYVVDGLTIHLQKWERKGWLEVANAQAMREVVARLRARSAPTTLRWVKGHSDNVGNEAADRLAKEGAAKACATALAPVNTDYLRRGTSLRWLTQRLAYKGIRVKKDTGDREATVLMVAQVRDALQYATKATPTEAVLWKSVRDSLLPRRMRDFWWKALHNALRVGKFWSHIPNCEMRAECGVCGCEESLEHILLECSAPGQAEVWECVDGLLQRANIPAFRRSIGVVLGAPALDIKELSPASTKGQRRLVRILLTEAVHLIWKMRCERVIQHGGDPEKFAHTAAVRARWNAALNRRLRIDQGLTAKRLQKKALTRELVRSTWDSLVLMRDNLPEDWIGKPGVLVGILGDQRGDGVG